MRIVISYVWPCVSNVRGPGNQDPHIISTSILFIQSIQNKAGKIHINTRRNCFLPIIFPGSFCWKIWIQFKHWMLVWMFMDCHLKYCLKTFMYTHQDITPLCILWNHLCWKLEIFLNPHLHWFQIDLTWFWLNCSPSYDAVQTQWWGWPCLCPLFLILEYSQNLPVKT